MASSSASNLDDVDDMGGYCESSVESNSKKSMPSCGESEDLPGSIDDDEGLYLLHVFSRVLLLILNRPKGFNCSLGVQKYHFEVKSKTSQSHSDGVFVHVRVRVKQNNEIKLRILRNYSVLESTATKLSFLNVIDSLIPS